MKKIISLIILFCLLIPILINAQTFNGGISGGLVASQVAGDTYSGYNKAGLFGGIFINHKITTKGLLQFEIDYIQKGSRQNAKPETNEYTYILRANYIETALLYRHHISKKIDLEAGFAPGFLVNSKETIGGGPGSGNEFQSFSLSTIFGIYYYLNERMVLNFRTGDSIFSIRKNALEGYVKRFTSKYGQYHDLLVISFFYQLNHQ